MQGEKRDSRSPLQGARELPALQNKAESDRSNLLLSSKIDRMIISEQISREQQSPGYKTRNLFDLRHLESDLKQRKEQQIGVLKITQKDFSRKKSADNAIKPDTITKVGFMSLNQKQGETHNINNNNQTGFTQRVLVSRAADLPKLDQKALEVTLFGNKS